MPSEMTSTPERFFSCTLRSISANRYGGIRPRRFAPATVLLIQVVEDTGHRIRLDLEPPHPIVAPPPPQLASRVAAVRPRHRMRKLLNRQLATEVGHGVRVADAGQHWRRRRHPRVERRLRLGNQSPCHLLRTAPGKALVDHIPRRRQSDAERAPGRWSPRAQAAQRGTCRFQDLDRADYPDRIVEIDPRIIIDRQQPLTRLYRF